MPNFLSQDDIEQTILQRLQHQYGYDMLKCYSVDADDLNDGSGRMDKRDVILRDRLKASAVALNPEITESSIDEAVDQRCDRRLTMGPLAANWEMESLIRDGVPVEFTDRQGRMRQERVRVIEFTDPKTPTPTVATKEA